MGADKSVTILLKLELDRSNVQSARQAAEEVRKIQSGGRGGTSDSARQERIREFEREQREANATVRRGETERGRMQAEANRRTIDILRQEDRERGRAAAGYERFARQQEVAGRLIVMSSMQAVHGVLQVARGVAMLGLVGEKDTQKLIDGLIKIQFGFDALRGGASIVMGLSRAWTAVAASARAAAAAQAVAGGVGAAGSAVGAGGLAGGVGAGAMRMPLALLALEGVALAGIGLEAGANLFGNYPKPGTLRSGFWDTVAGGAAWQIGSHGPSSNTPLWSPFAGLAESEETVKRLGKRTFLDTEERNLESARQRASTMARYTSDLGWAAGTARGATPGMRGIDEASNVVYAAQARTVNAYMDVNAAPRGQAQIDTEKALKEARTNELESYRQVSQLRIQAVQQEGAILQQLQGQTRALEDQAKARERATGSVALSLLAASPEERENLRRGLEKTGRGVLGTQEERAAVARYGGTDVQDQLSRLATEEANRRMPWLAAGRIDTEADKRMAEDTAQRDKAFGRASKNFEALTGARIDLNTSVDALATIMDNFADAEDKSTRQLTDTFLRINAAIERRIAVLEKQAGKEKAEQQAREAEK